VAWLNRIARMNHMRCCSSCMTQRQSNCTWTAVSVSFIGLFCKWDLSFWQDAHTIVQGSYEAKVRDLRLLFERLTPHKTQIMCFVRLCVCVLTYVCVCVDMCVCVFSLLCVCVLTWVCLCVNTCVCVTCFPTSSSAPHEVAAAAACSSSVFALFAASLSLYRMSHKSFLWSFYMSHVELS